MYIGRAGRDQLPALCVTFLTRPDFVRMRSLAHAYAVDRKQVSPACLERREREGERDGGGGGMGGVGGGRKTLLGSSIGHEFYARVQTYA